MNLSISNIAWTSDNDVQMYAFLKETGYNGLEIAPTRLFIDHPYTHIEEAQIVGERLRKAVEETSIPIDKKNINVTISMGLAEFSPQETGEDLFKRADSALYEAKESGRNRVCIEKNVKH